MCGFRLKWRQITMGRNFLFFAAFWILCRRLLLPHLILILISFRCCKYSCNIKRWNVTRKTNWIIGLGLAKSSRRKFSWFFPRLFVLPPVILFGNLNSPRVEKKICLLENFRPFHLGLKSHPGLSCRVEFNPGWVSTRPCTCKRDKIIDWQPPG